MNIGQHVGRQHARQIRTQHAIVVVLIPECGRCLLKQWHFLLLCQPFPLAEQKTVFLKAMSYEPQEQDLFLKCLLEANVDGIIAFDRECRYTTWNRAMEHISGGKQEDVLGKNGFEMFPSLKNTGEVQFYLDALAGKSVVAENRPYIIAQSGCNGFFDGYYSPRHDEHGEVVGGGPVVS